MLESAAITACIPATISFASAFALNMLLKKQSTHLCNFEIDGEYLIEIFQEYTALTRVIYKSLFCFCPKWKFSYFAAWRSDCWLIYHKCIHTRYVLTVFACNLLFLYVCHCFNTCILSSPFLIEMVWNGQKSIGSSFITSCLNIIHEHQVTVLNL